MFKKEMYRYSIFLIFFIFVLFNLGISSAQPIQLAKLDVKYLSKWIISEEQVIDIFPLDINNNIIDAKINISFFNESLLQYQTFARPDNSKRVRVSLFNNTSPSILNFTVVAIDGSKVIENSNYSVEIIKNPSSRVSDKIKAKISNMVKNIKDNLLEYIAGGTFLLLLFISVLFWKNSSKD